MARQTPTLVLMCLVVVFMLAGAANTWSAPTPLTSPRGSTTQELKNDAEAAQAAGRWETALELYFRLYTSGLQTEEIRNRIRLCLRAAQQHQRHRSPEFQDYVLSLNPGESLALYLEVIQKIHSHYAERSRAGYDKLFASGLKELENALTHPGFRSRYLSDVSDQRIAHFRSLVLQTWQERRPGNARDLRMATRELVALAQSQLGMKNPSALILELICGACSGLDDYSHYDAAITPNESLKPMLDLSQYGLIVAPSSQGYVVESVLAYSWCQAHTTLLKGDRIVSVNGERLDQAKTLSITWKRAWNRTGQESHQVLEIQPVGSTETVLIKFPKVAPSVYAVEMLDPKQGIGKIRMGTFQESTPRELREAIDHLKASGLRGLILDLRGNPGGNFMAAVDSARLFLPDGIIVSTSGQIDEFSERYFTSEQGMLAWDFPVAIVVDSRTMSSAEIFTSALVDQGRAVVVGTTTFGKGMIQSPIPLRGPESLLPGRAGALWLSTGVALRSGGIPVEGHGIVPQFVEPDCERQLPLALEKLLDLVRIDMITDPMMKE